MKVSIIIVTWNSEKFLNKCYCALQNQTMRDFEIVVVDNGSTDNSVAVTNNFFPNAKILRNESNIGFAVANNQGIKVSSEEYILLLNTDCYLKNDYIEKLVKYLDNHKKAAGVQGKLLLEADRSIVDSLGIKVKVTGVAKDIGQGQKDSNISEPFGVDALCAAAAMFRKESLNNVAKDCECFDSDFISYYEDVDLGMRLQSAGYELMTVPDAVAFHVRGGAQKDIAKMHRLALRNKYFVIIKNWSVQKTIVRLPFILGWESVKFFKFLFTSPSVLYGYLDVIRDMRLFIRKRNA